MAETEKLNKEIQEQIAAEIGKNLADAQRAMASESSLTSEASPAPALELAEELPVWMLDSDDIDKFRESGERLRLKDLARPTNRWHHQLKSNGTAEAYSRSQVSNRGSSVREIFYSKLAAQIQQGIAVVDQNVPDDHVARLLVAPAYQLHSLWCVKKPTVRDNGSGSQNADEGTVLVVAAPRRYELAAEKFWSPRDFLKALASKQPVRGLIMDDENN